jgi:hypothetical protein
MVVDEMIPTRSGLSQFARLLRIASTSLAGLRHLAVYETAVRKQRLWKNSLEIIMPNFAHQNDVQIDRVHNGAIRKEMGEKLSVALGPQSLELPARLLVLMQQLEKVELANNPGQFGRI